MEIPPDILTSLVDVLAKLYPHSADARTMARLVGLNETQIDFTGKAESIWLNVVREAELQRYTSSLLARAKQKYPNYSDLARACDAYAKWAATNKHPDSPNSFPLRRIVAWVLLTSGIVIVVLLVLGILNWPWPPITNSTPTLVPPVSDPKFTSTPTPQATPTGVTKVTITTTTATWQPPASPTAFDWVEIPAGEFTMGSDDQSDPSAYDDEQPKQREYVDTFWIVRTEVTVAQFAAFVEATGYDYTRELDVANRGDHPVSNVSWYDAQAFSDWAGVRLPTEAEWEKAARGTDGRIYPWGNDAPDRSRCNFSRNVGDTTVVGSYPNGISPYGLLDMCGNVWEWTQTKWRNDYTTQADNSREGIEPRVVRGGSFDDPGRSVRTTVRNGFSPTSRFGVVSGFRVAVSPKMTLTPTASPEE